MREEHFGVFEPLPTEKARRRRIGPLSHDALQTGDASLRFRALEEPKSTLLLGGKWAFRSPLSASKRTCG